MYPLKWLSSSLIATMIVASGAPGAPAERENLPGEAAAGAYGPEDGGNRRAGSGSVTWTLTGTTLTINGTFEGLKSPATMAPIHKGQRGVRERQSSI